MEGTNANRYTIDAVTKVQEYNVLLLDIPEIKKKLIYKSASNNKCYTIVADVEVLDNNAWVLYRIKHIFLVMQQMKKKTIQLVCVDRESNKELVLGRHKC